MQNKALMRKFSTMITAFKSTPHLIKACLGDQKHLIVNNRQQDALVFSHQGSTDLISDSWLWGTMIWDVNN